MYQRPRANGKGVAFGGPDPNALTTVKRHHGNDEDASNKKRKLSESSTPQSNRMGLSRLSEDNGSSKYQYQSVSPMILGSPEARKSEAPNSPVAPGEYSVADVIRGPTSVAEPPVRSIDLETVELKAEEVIHFSKISMREAAAKSRAYAPSAGSTGAHSSSNGAALSANGASSSGSHANAEEAKTLPPWATKPYANGPEGLETELWDFYNWLQPTREERMLRIDLVERLRSALVGRFPKCEVRFFGSLATDLLLPSSDVDLVVLGVPAVQSNLWIVRTLLTRHGFSNAPTVIAHARVPLVKFTDITTGIDVDISFDHANGLQNTKVINSFAVKYKTYRPLLVILKFYLHQLGINEPYNGGLGSYALSLMVASFLQMHPKTNNVTGATDPNLGYLLLDFFALYGKQFNFFNTGISVLGNGSYFSKIERGWIDPEQPFLAAIEDPNDETNDVGRSGHRILTVRTYFKDAYMKLSNFPSGGLKESSLLSRVLWPDVSLEHFRSHLPALVEQLMTSPTFQRNTKHIASLYGADGQLKEGTSHTDLGEAQTHAIPNSVSRPRAKAMQHLMFESDDESDILSVDLDDEGVRDFFTDDDEATSQSDNDHLAPIVISSDDSSSEEEVKGSKSKRGKWNPKKRKR